MDQHKAGYIEDIAKSVHGIFWEADANTFQFLYVSPQSKKMLGYDPQQWYESATFWKDHIHPDDRVRAVCYCHEQTKEGKSHSFEYRMIANDGSIVWLKDVVTVLFEDGKPSKLRGLMVDISKQKEMEAEKKRLLNESYQLAKIGDWKLDLITQELYWSAEVKELHGVKDDYMPDTESAIQFYKSEDERQKIRDAVNQAIKQGKPYKLELQIVTEEGEERWVRTAGKAKKENGQVVQLYGSIQDITQQKEYKEQLEMLSRVASETHNIVIITGSDGNIKWVNKAFENLTGYTFEEAQGENPGTLLQGPETDKKTSRRIGKKIRQEEPFTDEILNYTKTGEKYWVKIDVTPIFDEQGNLKQYFSIQEDITEQKQSFEVIRHQKQILEETQRIGKLGSWIYDFKTDLITWSPVVYEIYDRDPEQEAPRFDELRSYCHTEDAAKFDSLLDEVITKEVSRNSDFKITTETGQIKYVHAFIIPIMDSEGGVSGLKGIIQDITKRKTAEISLKDQQSRLKNITDNLEAMIHRYVRHPDGKEEIVFISESVKNLHEVSPESVLEDSGVLWSQIADDHKESVRASVDESAKEMSTWDEKWKIITPSGKEKWIHGFGTPREKEDGTILWDALSLDITEKEIAKRQNKELQDLIQNSFSEIYVFGMEDFEIVYTNDVAAANFGYTKSELLGKTPLDLNPNIHDNHYLDDLKDQLKKRSTGMQFESRHQRADGSTYPVRVFLKKGTYEDKQIIIGAAIDISEQKKFEQKLKEHVAFADSIIDSLPGLFYMMDEDHKFVRVNQNLFEFFDITEDDLHKINPFNLIAESNRPAAYEKVEQVYEHGYAELQTVLVHNEAQHHFYMNGKLLEMNGQKYILGNGIDITDRIEIQEDNRVLLKEVHHRVKNNLAIISGLLQLEMNEFENSRAKLSFQRSINRIQSMAKVHEMLYDTDDFTTINIHDYISDLTRIVRKTFGKTDHIKVDLHVESVQMNINEAIPLGMLLNELITNSFKYAFGDSEGTITIRIDQNNTGYDVDYRDNGKGMEQVADLESPATLGFTIVSTLLSQLQADYELHTDNQFKLSFTFDQRSKGSHSNL